MPSAGGACMRQASASKRNSGSPSDVRLKPCRAVAPGPNLQANPSAIFSTCALRSSTMPSVGAVRRSNAAAKTAPALLHQFQNSPIASLIRRLYTDERCVSRTVRGKNANNKNVTLCGRKWVGDSGAGGHRLHAAAQSTGATRAQSQPRFADDDYGVGNKSQILLLPDPAADFGIAAHTLQRRRG